MPVGDDGNNTLFSTPDSENIYAFAGADRIVVNPLIRSAFQYVNGGDGIDTLVVNASAQTLGISASLIAGDYLVQAPVGFAFDIFVRGEFIEKVDITGGSGTDFLAGMSLDDILRGGPGNDHFTGGGKTDTTGFGKDTLLGGPGFDTVSYAATDARLVLLGNKVSSVDIGEDTLSGIEKVIAGIGNDGMYGSAAADTFLGNMGDDYLTGFGGSDTLDGGQGDDRLDGGAANDTLQGGEGLDRLEGGDAKDTLRGGNGLDHLFGEKGVDRLIGGVGPDRLTGGADQDFFMFDSTAESRPGSFRDIILDFNRAEDWIYLTGIDAKTGVAGNQAFTWIGQGGFNDHKGELRFTDAGANCIVEGDTNGDGREDFEIYVKVATLAKGDFFL